MPTEWTCTGDATSTHCVVDATTTPQVLVVGGVTYHDWILFMAIFLFFISFRSWDRIFYFIKTLFYGN